MRRVVLSRRGRLQRRVLKAVRACPDSTRVELSEEVGVPEQELLAPLWALIKEHKVYRWVDPDNITSMYAGQYHVMDHPQADVPHYRKGSKGL